MANTFQASSTILVKTLGTLCVLGEENVILVDPPPPPEQCWVLQVKHLLHILCTLWSSTLFSGGWEKSLVNAVFMSVYCRLAANSKQKPSEKGEVSQNLLARIARKFAIPKSLPNVIILHFQFWLLQRWKKCWNFSMFGWIFTSSGAHTAYSLNFGMD